MKDIKFRYYENKTKEMFYDVQDIYKEENKGIVLPFKNFGELIKALKKDDSIGILMEYTGFNDDIDKKEIYEGDIIRFKELSIHGVQKNTGYNIGKVIFNNGSWLVDSKYITLGLYGCENIKILGNIYENPELLER